MNRDKLPDTVDVVVVGGGIHGATVFDELCHRGYETVLLERDDFCAATSSNSLKVLHGGLRYLQHANFKRMRESICSRRSLMARYPHLSVPTPFIMPTRGLGLKSRAVMQGAMLANDLVGWDRNRGIPADSRLPAGRVISRSALQDILGSCNQSGATGAARWYDTVALDSERMVLELIKEGVEQGGQARNYVQVTGLLRGDGKVEGVIVIDHLHGEEMRITCKLVINAAGPWCDALTSSTRSDFPANYAKAVNLVLNTRLFDGYGVGLEGGDSFQDQDAMVKRDRRLFFFVPWRGLTMIGTTYQFKDSSETGVSQADIDDILDTVNQICPTLNLTTSDVLYGHAGWVPAYPDARTDDRQPQLVKHSEVLHNEPGLVSIGGVKFTTAPSVAEQVGRLVAERLPGADVRVGKTPGSVHRNQSRRSSLTWLQRYRPSDHDELLSMADLDAWVLTDPPVHRAEVLFGIRREAAVHLTDMVFRRLTIGNVSTPEPESVRKIAAVMAEEMGWTDVQLDAEISALWRFHKNRCPGFTIP